MLEGTLRSRCLGGGGAMPAAALLFGNLVLAVQGALPQPPDASAEPGQALALFADSRELLVLGSTGSEQWVDAFLAGLPVPRTLHRAQPEAASRMRDVLVVGLSNAAGLRAALTAAPSWSFRRALVWLSNATGSLPAGLLQGLAEAAWDAEAVAVHMAVTDLSGGVALYRVAPYQRDCGPGVVALGVGDVTGVSTERWDLCGCPLRLSTLHSPPHVSILPGGRLGGMIGKVVQVLANALNFTYSAVQVGGRDGDGVGWMINGSASGIVRDLREGEADLAVARVMIRADRLGAVDITGVPEFMCGSVAVPAGLKARPGLGHALLSEFPASVWVCLTVCLAVVVASSWTLSIPDSTLVLVGSLLEAPAPSHWLPASLPARLLFGGWVAAGLVLSSVYKSQLRGELIARQHDVNIQTLGEFEETKLPLLLQTAMRHFLETDLTLGDSEEAHVWRRIAKRLENSEYGGDESSMRRVGERRDAGFFVATHAVDYLRDSLGLRDLVHSLGGYICRYNALFMLRRGSFLTPAVQRLGRRLHDAGLLHHWQLEQRPARRPRASASHPLRLPDLQEAFLLLSAGLAAAAAACAAERVSKLRVVVTWATPVTQHPAPSNSCSNGHVRTVVRNVKQLAKWGFYNIRERQKKVNRPWIQ